jgi:hypothetical protein
MSAVANYGEGYLRRPNRHRRQRWLALPALWLASQLEKVSVTSIPMPDVDAADGRRRAWLHPILFWGGVGLAPLAALLILLGAGGTPVRIGAVMGVMAPVMIGISFAMRPDPETIRLHFEETLLEELDLLRGEVREEIANSARASHQMVGERLGALQQTVDTLRAAAATRVGPSPPVNGQPTMASPYQAAAAAPAPPVASRASVPRSAAPPPAAGRSAPPPPAALPRSATPPGAPRSAAPPAMGRPAPSAVPYPSNGYPSNGRASVAPPGRGAGGRSGRHQASAPTGAGYNGYNGYNGEYGGGEEWTPPAPRRRSAEPYEESWTDQKLRERYGRSPGGEIDTRPPRPYGGDPDYPSSGEPYRRREDGQWAPVSAEPGGRRRRRWEDDSSLDVLRDGDRRSGRHSGETGTQPRYDDRWSAGREEANGNGYGGGNGNGYRSGSEYGGNGNGYGGNGYGNGRPDYTRRALPAGSSEPSWNDSWEEEPARDARSHRYRPDFELTDERWR